MDLSGTPWQSVPAAQVEEIEINTNTVPQFRFVFSIRQFNYSAADYFLRHPVKNKVGEDLWREQSESWCRAWLGHLVVSLEHISRVAGQQLFHPQWRGFIGHMVERQFFFSFFFLEWLQDWRIVLNDSFINKSRQNVLFFFNVYDC